MYTVQIHYCVVYSVEDSEYRQLVNTASSYNSNNSNNNNNNDNDNNNDNSEREIMPNYPSRVAVYVHWHMGIDCMCLFVRNTSFVRSHSLPTIHTCKQIKHFQYIGMGMIS